MESKAAVKPKGKPEARRSHPSVRITVPLWVRFYSSEGDLAFWRELIRTGAERVTTDLLLTSTVRHKLQVAL